MTSARIAPEPPGRSRARRRIELLLFVGLLAVYNLNLRQVSSHDTYASRFVPISILRDGDLILDEFVPDAIKQQAGDDFFSYYFAYVRGHFYDSHPPVGPLLSVPVYALPAWIGIAVRPELLANVFSKLAASLMVALSGVLIFRASRQMLFATLPGRDQEDGDATRIALIAAIAYGLGTGVWSTASLAMWTHTPAVLGFALALWALTRGRFAVAGATAAAAWLARPATAPALALLGMYLAHRALRHPWSSAAAAETRVHALRFCAAAAFIGLAGILYNYWLFDNPLGGAPSRMPPEIEALGGGMFSGSLWAGLAGLTVSPSRGILIYSPVVLAAVYGAARVWQSALDSDWAPGAFGRGDAVLLLRYSSLAALALLLTYSKFIMWWGGHGYGPRYLTDAMPFLGPLFALGLAPIFRRPSRARAARVAVTVALMYSIAVHAIGAFCWPSSWTLNDKPPYRDRLWDWTESDIELCIRDGPRIDPAARALFNKLGL